MRRIALFALTLTMATSALAAPDSMWVNPAGELSGLRVDNDPVVPLQPGTRSLAEIISGFEQLCIATNFDKLAVNRARIDAGWSGRYMPSMMATNSGDVDLGGWQGDDHSLMVAKDVFFSPNPQCVLAVATVQRFTAMEIFPEITAKFGKPANYADMFHADRTPNDSVRPHWVVSTTDDRERVMFARSLARSGEYRVHLALIERKIAE